MNERRIAIIDDDTDAAKTLKDCFDRSGQREQVTVFDSCENFLAAGTDFDALVTDTNLGDDVMDGISCAGEIRRRNPTAVIVGTSLISENEGDPTARESELRTIYRRSGADDFINSAMGVRAIVQRVFELLDTEQT